MYNVLDKICYFKKEVYYYGFNDIIVGIVILFII